MPRGLKCWIYTGVAMGRFLESMWCVAACAACLGIPLIGVGCGGEGTGDSRGTRVEGTEPGDCEDGADNDADGLFDCADPSCEASPLCEGGAGGGTGTGGAGGVGGRVLCADVDCDDQNECTIDACDPLDGECDYTNVTAGMTCDFGELPGVCNAGACEDAMLCADVVCDDDNECTSDACDPMDGSCDFTTVVDGTSCDFGGLPGTCNSGACEGLCTCEAQGVECGNATICGSPTLCGTCQDSGFDDGYHCASGRCVCEDPFEFNDTFQTSALVCGEGTSLNCMQDAWGVDLQATLHSSTDIDYYALQVLDSTTPLIAQTYGGRSDRILFMTYLCPDGSEGIDKCSGSTDSIGGIKFCIAEGDTVGIERRCDSSASPHIGTVLVRVEAREFQGECDGYDLNIYATYATVLMSLSPVPNLAWR